MTKRTRRTHLATFKAKVAAAEVKGEWMLAELAQQVDVQLNQVTKRKRRLQERAADLFGSEQYGKHQIITIPRLVEQGPRRAMCSNAVLQDRIAARPARAGALRFCHPLEYVCETTNGLGRHSLKQKTTEISTFDRVIDADDESERMLQVLASVLEGLGGIVSPNTELILHDMRDPSHSTIALVNGHVTGRQLGDPIIAAPVDDKGFELLLEKRPSRKGMTASISQYRSRTKDGHELLSATVLLRNRKGLPFASVCANADLTDYQLLHAALGRLIAPSSEAREATADSRPNLDEMIEEIVSEAIQRAGIPVSLMDKAEKLKVVSELTKRGVFMIKGAVERVAQALGVTRFTIYNYLEALGFPRNGKAAPAANESGPVKATRKTARRRSR